MSDINYLFIKNLKAAVPDAFVPEVMRGEYRKIISQCPVTDPLLQEELNQLPTDGKKLIPIAYNLIVEANANADLLQQTMEKAPLMGYWFFNAFIIPQDNDDTDALVSVFATLASKGTTRGIDQVIP